MYERYWGLQKSPFRQAPDGDLFFPAKPHRAALLKLRFLIEQRPGLGLLVGQGGSGKSLVCDLVRPSTPSPTGESSGDPIHRIEYPYLSPQELLNDWAIRLGCQPAATSVDAVIRTLSTRLQVLARLETPQVLILEDAHLYEDRRVFDTIGAVLNVAQHCQAPLSIILSGHPELLGILRRQHALDERLGVQAILEPLTQEETSQYVEYRLQTCGRREKAFDESALNAIYALSAGNPRRINRLCDYALLMACAEKLPMVTSGQIEAAGIEFSWSRVA